MTKEEIILKLEQYGIKILIAVTTIILGIQLIKLTLKMIDKLLTNSKIEASYIRFIIPFLKVSFYILLFVFVFESLFNNSGTIIAILGSAGLAISLSFQSSLSNLASGILILFTKPFKVGDYIIGEKIEGKVDAIGLIYTSLMTLDLKRITIPNSIVANSPITNVSASNYRRVEIVVGISYDSDIKLAKEILLDIYHKHPNIVVNDIYDLDVNVKNLGASSVDLRVYGYVKNDDYWKTYFDLLEQVKINFDDKGIKIPFKTINVNLSK